MNEAAIELHSDGAEGAAGELGEQRPMDEVKVEPYVTDNEGFPVEGEYFQIDMRQSSFAEMRVGKAWYLWPVIFMVWRVMQGMPLEKSLVSPLEILALILDPFEVAEPDWPVGISESASAKCIDLERLGFQRGAAYQAWFIRPKAKQRITQCCAIFRPGDGRSLAIVQGKGEGETVQSCELVFATFDQGMWRTTRDTSIGHVGLAFDTEVVKGPTQAVWDAHQQRLSSAPESLGSNESAKTLFARYHEAYLLSLEERGLLHQAV